MRLLGNWLGGALFTLLILAGYQAAFADGNLKSDDVPKLVPYKGTLEKDGVAFTGTVEMRFDLFDGAGADAADFVWTETHTVAVHNGAFSVMLGSFSSFSSNALMNVLNKADDVYLSITLDPSGDNVALTQRQRFVPVPYALWSQNATYLTVGQRIVIESNQPTNSNDGPLVINDATGLMIMSGQSVNTNGNLLLNNDSQAKVSTGGDLDVDGDITVGYAVDIAFGAAGDGGTALRHGNDDRLVVNSNGSLGDLTHIQSALEVSGASTLSGGATVTSGATVYGGLTVSGNSTFNNNLTVSGTVNGLSVSYSNCANYDLSANFTDNQPHSYYCGGNKVMVGGIFRNINGDGSPEFQVTEVRCCTLSVN